MYSSSTPKHRQVDLLKNNYLKDPAYSLVKSLNDIDDIWVRLKKAYGDKKILLNNKLSAVTKMGSSLKAKDPEQLKGGLIMVINAMNDLIELAEKHNIQNKLYYGEGLNMIYKVLGEGRLHRWLTSIVEENLEERELWTRLIKFLEKDLKVAQEKALVTQSFNRNPSNPSPHDQGRPRNDRERRDGDNRSYPARGGENDDEDEPQQHKCHFCGEYGHVTTRGPRGIPLVQYYACEQFVTLPPQERFRKLREKGLCHQCLYPGAKQNEGKHAEGTCQKTFACRDPSHNAHPCKKHVLVCAEHADKEENVAMFNDYKERFITRQRAPLADYSKNIRLSFFVRTNSSPASDAPASDASSYAVNGQVTNGGDTESEILETDPQVNSNLIDSNLRNTSNTEPEIRDSAVFALQIINIDGDDYVIFYDNGCNEFVTRHDACLRLKSRATQIKANSSIGGVGESRIEAPHGEWRVELPLHNGNNVPMEGVCLNSITGDIPMFPLDGAVLQDIKNEYAKADHDPAELPSLAKAVGGQVDFMIGSKYLKYHPKVLFELPSGLTIYESVFINSDGGGRGVVCGPHHAFNRVGSDCNLSYFMSPEFRAYRAGVRVENIISTPYEKDVLFNSDEGLVEYDGKNESHYAGSRKYKSFLDAENAGSVITYRCPDCRGCQKCKNNEEIEDASVEEEIQQELIVKSVELNPVTHRLEAVLPWIENPLHKLAPNRTVALKYYYRVVQKLNKCEKDKSEIIAAEMKLQKLGYVEYVHNLTSEQQKRLKESVFQNFITWFPVWNSNSVTTACRPVFNASLKIPETGYSMNDLMAKGKNGMNKLAEISIRWTMHPIGMHTDVKQLYNRIMLKESDWCFQRYIWEENLDPKKIPFEKIIMTVIYGVSSSGNQAERGLRMTADLCKESHPEEHRIIHKDLYADDCLTGAKTNADAYKLANALKEILALGGFDLKGFTFSGRPPDPDCQKTVRV